MLKMRQWFLSHDYDDLWSSCPTFQFSINLMINYSHSPVLTSIFCNQSYSERNITEDYVIFIIHGCHVYLSGLRRIKLSNKIVYNDSQESHRILELIFNRTTCRYSSLNRFCCNISMGQPTMWVSSYKLLLNFYFLR